MGKKKPPKATMSEPDEGVTAAELSKIASQLHTAATRLEAKAERMKQEKMPTAPVDGIKGIKRERGVLDLLRRFVASCDRHIPDF